jgi:hypothetical protein
MYNKEEKKKEKEKEKKKEKGGKISWPWCHVTHMVHIGIRDPSPVSSLFLLHSALV